MFAALFRHFGGPEVLELAELPEPQPGPGQVRIRVRAAGVSPVDLGLRSGGTPTASRLALPHIPGVDAAGVVDALGAGVGSESLGDEVFGSVDVARLGGATAEFAVLSVWAVKPAALDWAQAGGAGTGVETATRALDLLALAPGATLLVDGASGGVGVLAVQLAIARGLRVIGTGSPASHDLLTELDALPVAYGPGLASRVASAGVGIDGVLDIAGATSIDELVGVAGDPARVVSIANFGAAAAGARLSLGKLGGQPGGDHGLAIAAGLAELGRFQVPVEAAFPIAEVAAAHKLAAHGPRRGKIIVTVAR